MLIRHTLMLRFTLLALGIQLRFSACVYYVTAAAAGRSASRFGWLIAPRWPDGC